MNQTQLDEFQVLLEAKLNEIRATHDEHRDALPCPGGGGNELVGRERALENAEVENRIILNDGYYMEKIQKALLRIQAGTYGKCEACGKDIPIDRLYAKPSVSLCLKCQEDRETGF